MEKEKKMKTEGKEKLKTEGEEKLKTEEEKLKTEGEEKIKTEGEEKLKTEGEEKLKTEGEEKLKTKGEEKLQTEKEEMLNTEKVKKFKTEKELLIDAIKSKEGEDDEKLQRDKQEKERFKPSRILRDKSLQVGKNKIKQEPSRKDKVAISKTRKSTRMKTEGEEKLQTEKEEMLKTEKVKKLKTEKEPLIDTIKSKKGEGDEKLQKDKQEKERFKPSRILRDKNQQVEKNKIKQEPSKDKVAISKTRKSTEIKRDSSNIDESINKENKEITEKKKGDRFSIEEDSSQLRKEIKEFQKLQAQYLKEKQEALKKKAKLDLEAQKAKQKSESKANIEKRIKLAKTDNLSKRIKIKQPKKIRPSDIDPELLKDHKFNHYKSGQQSPVCPVCLDSDLEIEVLSLDYKTNVKRDKLTDIIIGEKIYKKKLSRFDETKKPEVVPIFLQKDFNIESEVPLEQDVQIIAQTEPVQKKILATVSKNVPVQSELELGKGIMRYALSDRTFIAKGWTMLPTEKVVRRMNVYRMRPAHPEFDWFEHNKNKRLMTYDTGERLAEFDDNGRGRWYYRSGRLALDYYDAEETNAQQRFVVYSSGEPDERGRTHPITILATFDYLGNGIVLDHAGKIRLKYNQTEGVVLDRAIGPVSHWKWHTLNDPPVLQQVMYDTEMANKDPNILKFGSSENYITRPDNEEMLAIEFENFIKDKTKKLSQKFKPFQIKMKVLKINEHFSLKVLDQATVYLIFRDGLTSLKINMGMILDDKEIVDTETSIVGEVSNSLERFPARTESLASLQRSVAHAQRYEKKHAKRERWLRPPVPCTSADVLNAAATSPMRLPLRTVPTGSSTNTGCSSSKPSNNLYYDTRLLY